MDVPPWEDLLAEAEAVLQAVVEALPQRLQAVSREVAVTFEALAPEEPPTHARAELEEDPASLMGLFLGEPRGSSGESWEPRPPQIVLYLEAIFIQAEVLGSSYADEVETTYLHELGHYLGLDEDALTRRGLE